MMKCILGLTIHIRHDIFIDLVYASIDSDFINEVMGGWEFGRGNYTAVSCGAVGF